MVGDWQLWWRKKVSAEFGLQIELCADLIVPSAARRSILVCGGSAWLLLFPKCRILISNVSKKNSYYKDTCVSQIFLADVWLEISDNNIIRTALNHGRPHRDKMPREQGYILKCLFIA